MIAAVGWTGVVLGLVSSIALAVQGLVAQRRVGSVSRRQLRLSVLGMVLGAVIAMAALQVALLTDDFSVSYVAENSARATPLLFKVTTAWSALSGSLVLWSLVLAGYTAVVLRQVPATEDRLGVGALAVMGAVATFFFGLLATAANPFGILANAPADGPGPNPLLQNHLMILVHPPMLYLGMVGLTVPFAFAISALLLGEGGVMWLRRTRRANLVAWTFLTGGLVYGGWWSYEVLGWGGYWAWDPVENVALIPWLLATAFIHSAVVQIRRGMLQAWNFILVLATFSMTILGTLLTRSSVVSSVHSFSQSGIGPALLAFFVVVLAGGFALFAVRGEQLISGRRPETMFSREGAFLVNNVLLTVFAFVVLLGTVYPVLTEVVTGDQVSVGRPFFDRLAVPLSIGLLLTMAVGPFMPYRRASAVVLWRHLRIPAIMAAAAAAVMVLAGLRSWSVILVGTLLVAVAAASVRELVSTSPDLRVPSVRRLLTRRRGYWGGQFAHIGLVVLALGITVSGGLAQRASVTLERGSATQVLGYEVVFKGIRRETSADRSARVAEVSFRKDGREVRLAEPALTQFASQAQAVGTPSVWSRPSGDLYVALASLQPDRISLNVYRYPLMWLVWLGGTMTALGGLWAWAGRRRTATQRSEPVGADREIGADV